MILLPLLFVADSACARPTPTDEREMRKLLRADSVSFQVITDETLCRRLALAAGDNSRRPVYAFATGNRYVVFPHADSPLPDEFIVLDHKLKPVRASRP